jgi:plastocyanin
MNRITLALGVALAALVAAAPVAARPSVAPAPTVTVTMKEFKFTLTRTRLPHRIVTRVPHGVVTFKLVNTGKLPHDFAIAGKKSRLIGKGKTGLLTVTLRKGILAYKCTVAGHAALGMKGKLTIT